MPAKKPAKRVKRRGSTRRKTAEAREAPASWLKGVRDPVLVVVKAAQGGAGAPCQVFGVDPVKRALVYAAEGTAPGLLERLMPGSGRGTVVEIEVAGLVPLRSGGSGTRPRQSISSNDGPIGGDPPPISQG